MPVYKYKHNAGIGKRPWFCPLRLVDDPVSTAYARRVYDAWRGGLVALVDLFVANQERLCAHVATGPSAPHQPWKAQG